MFCGINASGEGYLFDGVGFVEAHDYPPLYGLRQGNA
jgi:hypothetical protein